MQKNYSSFWKIIYRTPLPPHTHRRLWGGIEAYVGGSSSGLTAFSCGRTISHRKFVSSRLWSIKRFWQKPQVAGSSACLQHSAQKQSQGQCVVLESGKFSFFRSIFLLQLAIYAKYFEMDGLCFGGISVESNYFRCQSTCSLSLPSLPRIKVRSWPLATTPLL